MTRQSTSLRVPHPQDRGCFIAGILEQTEEHTTEGRPIALILHGTAGHKDYLYQKRLARELPLDSFRFDFRGNHETPGTWRAGALDEDIEDLAAVVAFLRTYYGYRIALLVGHSRGSIVGFRWMCTAVEAQEVDGFVNVSGRYRMEVRAGQIRGTILTSACRNFSVRRVPDLPAERDPLTANDAESPAVQAWKGEIAEKGFAVWRPVVARRQLALRVTPSDLAAFVAFDTSLVWARFPAHADVLSVHDLADAAVPPYDAVIYARALGGRTPGTHTLHLMEGAGHNFEGRTEELVGDIVGWWNLRTRGGLRDGVWGGQGKSDAVSRL